jgi:hypothetical protein
MAKTNYVMAFSKNGKTWQNVMARFEKLSVAKQFANLELSKFTVEIHRVTLDPDGAVLQDFGCVCALAPHSNEAA